MKKTTQSELLPYLTVGLSGLGIILRLWLYTTGLDDKGFLKTGHPAWILLWVLSFVTAAVLFWLTRPVKGQGRYVDNFPASWLGAAGCCAAAAGIFLTALGDLMDGADAIAIATGVLGVLCVPALIFVAYSRWRGMRSSFLLYVLLCVFFAARLISQYRMWSADPQLADYCFQLLACAGLMLTTYQRATFDLRMGRRRSYAFLCLLTVYFCCLSIPYCEQKLFYITAAVWLFTNLCSLKPLSRRVNRTARQPETPGNTAETPAAEGSQPEVP